MVFLDQRIPVFLRTLGEPFADNIVAKNLQTNSAKQYECDPTIPFLVWRYQHLECIIFCAINAAYSFHVWLKYWGQSLKTLAGCWSFEGKPQWAPAFVGFPAISWICKSPNYVQNTFWQSGIDSKCFLKNHFLAGCWSFEGKPRWAPAFVGFPVSLESSSQQILRRQPKYKWAEKKL